MNFAEVKNVLLDESFIDNIVCRGERQYADHEYNLVIRCDLILDDIIIPIVVGIPSDWQTMLFDFYVRDYESFPFIPHLENYGKLCLYDMEGVLIDAQFRGLLLQCFQRAAKVISDGISGENNLDFITEFDAYWMRLPNCGCVKFAVPEEKKNDRVYYEYEKIDKENDTTTIYAELKGAGVLRDWNKNGTMHRGCYIHLNATEFIYPPDPRDTSLKQYVNDLLRFVDCQELKGIIKHNDKPFIIFEIKQPNGFSTLISVIAKTGCLSETEGHYQFKDIAILYPLHVVRIDKLYLMSRVESGSNPMQKMRVLIIGAGSIGGYLASFLAKTGCEQMTLVDYQLFAEENLYRHVLDSSCIGHYKVEALAKKVKAEIPGISISTRVDHIETAVLEGSVDFAEYDVIFSVTGNHNINRWINNKIAQSEITIPVIYAWNEPLDIGYHTAIIRTDRPGSFDDLFGRDDETGELLDVTAFCSHKQMIKKNMAGCGGSFIPYGSEVSIQSATAAIDLLKRYSTGRNKNNEIVSYKGDGFFFKKAGLLTTQAYDVQNELVKRQKIVDVL